MSRRRWLLTLAEVMEADVPLGQKSLWVAWIRGRLAEEGFDMSQPVTITQDPRSGGWIYEQVERPWVAKDPDDWTPTDREAAWSALVTTVTWAWTRRRLLASLLAGGLLAWGLAQADFFWYFH